MNRMTRRDFTALAAGLGAASLLPSLAAAQTTAAPLITKAIPSTGELVPANDPHALAVALTPYVSDPGRAFSMRDRARSTIVSEFSPERHLERITATYALAARTMLPRAA